MGLFDIFKRRSKKAKEKEKQNENEVKEQQSVSSSNSSNDFQSATNDSINATSSESKSVVDLTSDQGSSESSNSPQSATESSTSTNEKEFKSSSISSSSESSASEQVLESLISNSDDNSDHKSTRDILDSSTNDSTAVKNDQSEVEPNEQVSDELQHPNSELSLKKDDESSNSIVSSESGDVATESAVESNSTNSKSVENDEKESFDKTSENEDAEKFEHGLAKSRSSFGQKLNALFANFRSVDDDFFDELEDTLIESDVGYNMAIELTDQLREEVKLKNVKKASEVQNVVVQKLIELYDQDGNSDTSIHFAKKGPTVIFFVGVNGVGKTTTVGKMANQYKKEGKKVLLAAADTFRAGAIQQLDVWAKRAGVDIVKKSEGSDPAAVVYEAVNKAKKENYDVLFVDTAGRLQNKVNLMNELAKMKKVLTREIPDAPHEVLLVLDATTGQNALNQAKLFKETTNVTGIVLTKLDGSARGGIILAIRNELHIPVKLVGLGEQINDLRPFNANDYIYGLFKGLLK